jgi:DNA-binding MarR family transcriptional regulator
MGAQQSPTFLETFGQLRRCLYGVVDAAYGALGIGATQAKLLRRIGENRHLSQADLARATGTDPALTGRALQTLLDRGWVKRRRSREDQRAFSLELTDSGEALLQDVLEAREAMALRVRACLSEDDLVAFDRISKKLLEAFGDGARANEATEPPPVDRARVSRNDRVREAKAAVSRRVSKSRTG